MLVPFGAGLKSLALNLGSEDDVVKSLRVACSHLSHLTELELAGKAVCVMTSI